MQNRIMIPGILALAIMGAMPAISNAATADATMIILFICFFSPL